MTRHTVPRSTRRRRVLLRALMLAPSRAETRVLSLNADGVVSNDSAAAAASAFACGLNAAAGGDNSAAIGNAAFAGTAGGTTVGISDKGADGRVGRQSAHLAGLQASACRFDGRLPALRESPN